MGLPKILLEFKTRGQTAIARSARGVVACVLKDNTDPENKLSVINALEDLDYTKWTEKNAGYLKLIYLSAPSKVIIARLPEDAADYAAALTTLRDLRWNYLTIPGIAASDTAAVSAWIKEQREDNRKTFKAVLPEAAADHEGIINLTTGGYTLLLDNKQASYTAAEYCARIAGILAAISLARSCTYYELPEVITAAVPDNADSRIDQGELVVVFDGEKYLIGRGVNSLVTHTAPKGKDLSKIKIVEGKDLYQDDVTGIYKGQYVGKVINSYDNKQAFVAAVNSYHRELEGDVLDTEYNNVAEINLEEQRKWLKDENQEVADMSDQEVAKANTGSEVFLLANIKFVDAMEDLTMRVNM